MVRSIPGDTEARRDGYKTDPGILETIKENPPQLLLHELADAERPIIIAR